jgi:hypothetical protein
MNGYRCVTCGAWHDERPMCFIVPLPEAVLQIPERQRGTRVEAGSDQCILDGTHFFILGNLDVPVRGSQDALRWSVWSTLSEANFKRASELWETAGRESEPPYFGWLSNQIPGYPSTINVKALVHTQQVGVRPKIKVIEEGHPLAADQENGIGPERLDELVHAAWHQQEEAVPSGEPKRWWQLW